MLDFLWEERGFLTWYKEVELKGKNYSLNKLLSLNLFEEKLFESKLFFQYSELGVVSL